MKEFQGCPIKLITDLGPENVLATAFQTYLGKILMHTSLCALNKKSKDRELVVFFYQMQR